MIKHYSSDSHVCLNVLLKSGKNMHISFTPLSTGGSIYSTDVEEVQNGLEAHYRFGSLFSLSGGENSRTASTEDKSQGSGEEKPKQGNLQKSTVSDVGEAKDYLADTFGVSRTSLKNQKSIIAAAQANGIVFEGL